MEKEYIGRYRITGRLGKGGMGTVLRAMDEARQREVALKLPNDPEPQTISRLQQECEVLMKLEHHNIVQVYGSGSDSDPALPFYIVMEFVDGTPLDELLLRQGGRLESRQALKIALSVAEALAYAHRPPLRVIHRDIKPANILIRRSDELVKVTDFGIAAVLAEKTGRTEVGTLAYMAPEQAMGQGVDERTDLYSLGALLYELLTGQRPPPLAATLAAPPSAARNSATLSLDAIARIDRLVLGLLVRDPNYRTPQRATDLVEELRALLEGRPSRALSGPQPGSGPLANATTLRVSGPTVSAPTQRASGPPLTAPYPPRTPSGPSGSGSRPSSGSYPPPPASGPYAPPSLSGPYAPSPLSGPYLQPPPMSAPVIIQPPIGQVMPLVVVQPSSGKATTALVLALLSLVAGPFTAIPGLIVGHMALNEIRRSGGAIGGSGKATAALVIGYIWVAIFVIEVLVLIITAAASSHPV
jgi:serine/threonine protein kinase